MELLKQCLAIGVGGFFGALSRYGVARLFQGLVETTFPLGTLVVNISGCFGRGGKDRSSPPRGGGFCGGVHDLQHADVRFVRAAGARGGIQGGAEPGGEPGAGVRGGSAGGGVRGDVEDGRALRIVHAAGG